MERVGALIGKLKEQYEHAAANDSLMVTAQMLVAELQQLNNQQDRNSTKKVSVIMPSASANNVVFQEKFSEKTPAPVVVETIPEPAKEEEKAVIKLAEKPIEKQAEKEEEKVILTLKGNPSWMFEEAAEAPTLYQQNKEVFELNEKMAEPKNGSMNDKLRSGNADLGNMLKDAPIKDLKKAIGINDRYLFINELFRGDETMYERSIKTINSFSILAEAEYWILRELKLKLAWNENSDAVALFDQLVKRRFS